jgi:2-methylcitrate dehydratase
LDKALEAMVDFVMKARAERLPDNVLDRCREILTDTLGCAIGGRNCKAAEVARRFPTGPTDEQGAVIGQAKGTAVDTAAFWNSAMTRYLDFNDALSGGHPSDMIGALVAMTAPAKSSGEDLLTAIAIAYEINARLFESVMSAKDRMRTMDQGYGVIIGATAGICHLLRMPRDQVAHAISLASTNGVPLRASRAGELSNYKGVATAVSARQSVFSVHMARCGMTAPPEPFEGRHGIVELMSGEEGPLNLPPFDSWRVLKTRFKYFPVAYNTQVGVWAAIELRKQVDFRQLEKITLRTSWFLWHESGSEPAKWDPQTRETADHSLPYIFASALRDGGITLNTFDMEKIHDPETRALMKCVSVVEDAEIDKEWPGIVQAKLDAVDKAGKTYHIHVKHPKGHDMNPFTAADIEAKFRGLVEPALGAERATAAFRAAWDTRSAKSFSSVLEKFVV